MNIISGAIYSVSQNTSTTNTNTISNGTPDQLEINAIQDMINLQNIIAAMKQYNPTPPDSLLRALCTAIMKLQGDCTNLENSGITSDQTFGQYAMFAFANVPFGSTTLLAAAEAYNPKDPDNVSAMRAAFDTQQTGQFSGLENFVKTFVANNPI